MWEQIHPGFRPDSSPVALAGLFCDMDLADRAGFFNICGGFSRHSYIVRKRPWFRSLSRRICIRILQNFVAHALTIKLRYKFALVSHMCVHADVFLNAIPHMSSKYIKMTPSHTFQRTKWCTNLKILLCIYCTQNICIDEYLWYRLWAYTCQNMFHGVRKRKHEIRGVRCFLMQGLHHLHWKKFAEAAHINLYHYTIVHRP